MAASGSGSGSCCPYRLVPPTVGGVREASGMLLGARQPREGGGRGGGGILSFPTETVYAMAACAAVRRAPRTRGARPQRAGSSSSSSSAASSAAPASAPVPTSGGTPSVPGLSRLLALKGLLPAPEAGAASPRPPPPPLGTAPDPALVYLPGPAQARELGGFTKPRTFALRPPPSSVSSSRSESASSLGAAAAAAAAEAASAPATASRHVQLQRVPAVTFSESREALDRLCAAFWPGPVVIYARARTGGGWGGGQVPSPPGGSATGTGTGTPPPPPPPGAPVLPAAALHSGPDGTQYVALRCPSHPLARRVLAEVYGRGRARHAQPPRGTAAGAGAAPPRRAGRSRVVLLGFTSSLPPAGRGDEPVPAGRPYPTAASEVCRELGSALGTLPPSAASPTVDVLNGEDEREMFAAPTCQFGAGARVALVLDDAARTVRIVERAGSAPGVRCRDVARALGNPPAAPCQQSPPPAGSGSGGGSVSVSVSEEVEARQEADRVLARTVSVVLRRWKVLKETY